MSSKQSQVCCVVIQGSAVCVPVAVVGGRLQSSRVDVRPRRVEVSDERAPAGRVQQQPITARLLTQQPITAQLTRAATPRHVQLLHTSQTTSSPPTPAKYCDERVCLYVCPRAVLFLFFSRPRSEGWPHHGRTFSIYPCPLSF